MMQSVSQPNPYNCSYPMLASHQPYLERLLEGFNFCLSPQQLPQNTTIRNYMDEELWIPIRVLYKLPVLDFLYVSEITIPFVTESLHKYSQETLEVDLDREMVRPKWALQSSVFISKVDENATTEQIYGLLDDIRLAVSHHTNPYDYRNITIAKHSPNAWSIGFKSPCAGAYAAMAMRMKCINGSMVLPMACMHINPPRASYIYAGIVVMEVDAIRYGAPFIPHELVPYYSENPEHIDILYRKTLAQYAAPAYVFYVGGNDPTPWERGNRKELSYTERNASHGGENYNNPGSRGNISMSPRAFTHGTNSHRVPDSSEARQKVPSTNQDLSRRNQSSEKTGSTRDRESVEVVRDTRRNSKHREQDNVWLGAEGVNRPAPPEENCGLNGRVKEGGVSACHNQGSRELNGHGVRVESGVASSGKGIDDDNESVIRFPNPELDKLPSPSFVRKANSNVMVDKGDSKSKSTEGRSENGMLQGSTARNRDGSRRGGKFGRRDPRKRASRDGENGGKILRGRKQHTKTDEGWQVISYQKSLQRPGETA